VAVAQGTLDNSERMLRPKSNQWMILKMIVDMKNVPIGYKSNHFWLSTLVKDLSLSR